MKIVSLLLIFAMLFSFAACNQTPVDPVDSDDESSADSDAADGTTAEPDPMDSLPAETFDGMTFTIWGDTCFENGYFIRDDADADGDVVAEAVISRNRTVEDHFDITFNLDITTDGKWRDMSLIRQSILNGDTYDLLEGVSLYAVPLTLQGCYTDLKNAKYQDFSQPWWAEHIIKELEITGRQFTASGFYDFPTITRSNVFYFNSTLVDDYDLPNMYELVENNEWTFDKMIELAQVVADDVNQDGQYDKSDMYGITGSWDSWGSQVQTAGYSWTTQDADGHRTATGLNDTIVAVSERVYPLITSANYYYSMYSYGGAHNEDNAIGLFCNDQILFMITGIGLAGDQRMRDMGTYGILPSPKYTEDQEFYGTSTSAFVCAIPLTAADFDTSSLILEALQIESYKQLRPAYYDTALSFKYLNDPKSVEMLDLVFQNVYCDFLYNYAQAGISSKLDVSAVAIKENIASYMAESIESANQALADLEEEMALIP